MKNIEDEVIKKIKDSRIKPIPKFWFVIKNILFIVGFLIFFCIGALSISVIISVLTDNVEFYRLTNNSLFAFLNVLPYFWIILLIIFLVIAYLNSKNINNSYKYFTLKNILATLLLCLLCGTFLHVIGISSILEHEIATHSKIYNDVIYCSIASTCLRAIILSVSFVSISVVFLRFSSAGNVSKGESNEDNRTPLLLPPKAKEKFSTF